MLLLEVHLVRNLVQAANPLRSLRVHFAAFVLGSCRIGCFLGFRDLPARYLLLGTVVAVALDVLVVEERHSARDGSRVEVAADQNWQRHVLI